MARGLSREQSQQKNIKKTQAGNKGNQEGLSATQRAERDAKILQEKAAAKAAQREALAKQSPDGAAAVAEEEKRKQAARQAKKERLANSTQRSCASTNRRSFFSD
uniref:Small EDRK-rich factor-like N-terminal domain-containing protein n=1 Tax=Chrysotila carterae TaxID=13221 RepID=A0A7S4B6A6_CHRCT